MINNQVILFCRDILSIVLAYILCMGPANGFKAWVAREMGDDTSERLGLLTFDSLKHVDLARVCVFLPLLIIASTMGSVVWFSAIMILAFLGMGWHTDVVIDSSQIEGKFRLFLAYFSDVAMYLFQGVLGLILLAGIGFILVAYFPAALNSVVTISLVRFMYTFVEVTIMLAIVSFVYDVVRMAQDLMHEQIEADASGQLFFLLFIIPLLFLLAFGPYIETVFRFIIMQIYGLLMWL